MFEVEYRHPFSFMHFMPFMTQRAEDEDERVSCDSSHSSLRSPATTGDADASRLSISRVSGEIAITIRGKSGMRRRTSLWEETGKNSFEHVFRHDPGRTLL